MKAWREKEQVLQLLFEIMMFQRAKAFYSLRSFLELSNGIQYLDTSVYFYQLKLADVFLEQLKQLNQTAIKHEESPNAKGSQEPPLLLQNQVGNGRMRRLWT